MTLRFILDENVVILAQKRENDRGEHDPSCFNLLQGILESNHSLVADFLLWSRYPRQLSGLTVTSPEYPHVLMSLSRAYQFGKIDIRENAPPFPEEANIPQGSQDDKEIIRLAVSTGAILVTTDNPLIADLETAGITQRYHLQVVAPDQALNLL